MSAIKNNKKALAIVTVLTILVAAVVITFITTKQNETVVDVGNLPVSRLHADFAINTDEPREIVGAADYYFVAMVNENVVTEYRNPVTIETENGFKEVADPYTNYSITIVKNIKGNLETDTPISITKSGGVSSDYSSLVLYENDELLEEGKHYVIAAYAQPDGSLLIVGPNSSQLIPTTAATRSGVISEADYSQYEMFYAEEVVIRERTRFVSEYDVSQLLDSTN